MTETASLAAQEAASKEVREIGLELNAINNAIKKISIDNRDGGLKENTFKITAMKVRIICLLRFEKYSHERHKVNQTWKKWSRS